MVVKPNRQARRKKRGMGFAIAGLLFAAMVCAVLFTDWRPLIVAALIVAALWAAKGKGRRQ